MSLTNLVPEWAGLLGESALHQQTRPLLSSWLLALSRTHRSFDKASRERLFFKYQSTNRSPVNTCLIKCACSAFGPHPPNPRRAPSPSACALAEWCLSDRFTVQLVQNSLADSRNGKGGGPTLKMRRILELAINSLLNQ